MALADSTNRGIARHLADVIEVEREHERLHAHPRGRERSFDPGVSGADYDDIVLHLQFVDLSYRQNRASRETTEAQKQKGHEEDSDSLSLTFFRRWDAAFPSYLCVSVPLW